MSEQAPHAYTVINGIVEHGFCSHPVGMLCSICTDSDLARQRREASMDHTDARDAGERAREAVGVVTENAIALIKRLESDLAAMQRRAESAEQDWQFVESKLAAIAALPRLEPRMLPHRMVYAPSVINAAAVDQILKGEWECRCDCVNCVTGNHGDCYYGHPHAGDQILKGDA
jgi:hypothetical protein